MDDTATLPENSEDQTAPIRTLSRPQRRVLGVLIEKGLTTPDAYPLTLKAVTAGCNQKSNRDPVTNYSEDAVEETLDDLRQLGLVAVVHTESGRTERFRHFMRKRYPFTEQQLAIVTELLLRGRQQLGELRSRASRMVAIEDQQELRDNLQQLAADDYIRASGPLERRGIEVDHTFYPEGEAPAFQAVPPEELTSPVQSTPAVSAAPTTAAADRHSAEMTELREEVQELRERLSEMSEELDQLKQSLGV